MFGVSYSVFTGLLFTGGHIVSNAYSFQPREVMVMGCVAAACVHAASFAGLRDTLF